jgi:hypothetical protein
VHVAKRLNYFVKGVFFQSLYSILHKILGISSYVKLNVEQVVSTRHLNETFFNIATVCIMMLNIQRFYSDLLWPGMSLDLCAYITMATID